MRARLRSGARSSDHTPDQGEGRGRKSSGDWALARSGVLKILRWSVGFGLWAGLKTTARPLKNPGPLKGEIVGSGEEVFSLLLCFSDCNYFFLE